MLVACCDHGFGHLDLALLENDLPLLAADDGIAQLPFDLVERVDTGGREKPREFEPRAEARRLAYGSRCGGPSAGSVWPVEATVCCPAAAAAIL